MLLVPIQVKTYSGHKADETPCSFEMEGQSLEIEGVLDRWYQVESKPEWPRATYFKVLASDRREYLLKHDEEVDEWYLCRRWEKAPPYIER